MFCLRAGLAYFGDGIKTLFSDVQYAWILILRAAQGYTLKPREVNAMRRTGKDLLTLIPFTIILIIPLTPIGHVLVFSFIQVRQRERNHCSLMLLFVLAIFPGVLPQLLPREKNQSEETILRDREKER